LKLFTPGRLANEPVARAALTLSSSDSDLKIAHPPFEKVPELTSSQSTIGSKLDEHLRSDDERE
jgi:hypothetical protein